MCIVGLNVATQPCAHRWYQLVRPCQPTNNLSNCQEKVRLEGWEIRNEVCPWCDVSDIVPNDSTHRLFGSTSSINSTASSPTSPELGMSRPRRSVSYGSVNSLNSLSNSLSRHSSINSVESDRGQKHREMNERLHLYLNALPHQVLPSARKNYPTYPQGLITTSTEETISEDTRSLRSVNNTLGKQWKKSVRLSKSMFKG